MIFRLSQNVKAITALVSEALRHSHKLETIIEKSELFKNEVALSKQSQLTKILITELLWGKKKLGGGSKPVITILSYQSKLEKYLTKLESDAGEGNCIYVYTLNNPLHFKC